jgi:hypothetical protein
MNRLLLGVLLFVGCVPDLGQPGSLVTESRVLAIRAEPAEANPQGSAADMLSRRVVQLDALVVSPQGTTLLPPLRWSFCLAPKPLSENNVASTDCLGSDPAALMPIGDPLAATTPDSACSNFGPETPAQKPGEPPTRPRDADITGGYYQPMRLALSLPPAEQRTRGLTQDVSIGLLRVSCNLAGAPPDIIRDYNKAAQGKQNRNPQLDPPRVFDPVSQNPIYLDEKGVLQADSGKSYTLQASWSAESVESYPTFDLLTKAVVTRFESMRVSWFTTAGSFAAERTGRDSDEAQRLTSSNNVWTAPATAGPATLWLVLRDDRGGIAWRELPAVVR